MKNLLGSGRLKPAQAKARDSEQGKSRAMLSSPLGEAAKRHRG